MKTILFTIVAALIASTATYARTINWGTPADSNLFTSSGVALDDSFTFELGSFGTFVPTESNMDLWSNNWKVFDRATALNGGWNSIDNFVTHSANLNGDTTSSSADTTPGSLFADTEQGYIWAFNTQQLAFGYTEWALITNTSADGNITDNWTFPSPTDHSDTALEWRTSTASIVTFGGLNSVQGPGDHTSDPQPHDLQTHAVVPEPGSALLIGMVTALTQLRRRKK